MEISYIGLVHSHDTHVFVTCPLCRKNRMKENVKWMRKIICVRDRKSPHVFALFFVHIKRYVVKKGVK